MTHQFSQEVHFDSDAIPLGAQSSPPEINLTRPTPPPRSNGYLPRSWTRLSGTPPPIPSHGQSTLGQGSSPHTHNQAGYPQPTNVNGSQDRDLLYRNRSPSAHHITVPASPISARTPPPRYYPPPGGLPPGTLPPYYDHTYLDAHPKRPRLFVIDKSDFIGLVKGPTNHPWFTYLSALAMLMALIYEFVRGHQLSGTVIQTNPFNPMVGPNFMTLVTDGARFTPCMRQIANYTAMTLVTNCYGPTSTCTLETVCGFGGFGGQEPHQSFRFVTPIFLHAGILHYLLNMIGHLNTGKTIERKVGTLLYMVLYMAAGVWGFVLSAMFNLATTASMGCSGALFGLFGFEFVNLMVNWRDIRDPCSNLCWLVVSIIISLAIGLLPGLDNFAHLGGFLTGLVVSAAIMPMRREATRQWRCAIWVVRILAVGVVVVMFVVTIRAFYSVPDLTQICPNCKYISCLPVYNWCSM